MRCNLQTRITIGRAGCLHSSFSGTVPEFNSESASSKNEFRHIIYEDKKKEGLHMERAIVITALAVNWLVAISIIVSLL